mmetsp:Transcript_3192/g.7488  ORF Transcript_3192/g.7488 Transcript_3192/m.7488 type:complete len:535 (+) Transcript_3192:26-1630(+)
MPPNLVSVALVGCAGTGKTSLASRAASQSQDAQRGDAEAPTLSVRRHDAVVQEEGSAVRVELWEAPIWDLALDPEAHFSRGCDAAIFVLDCTRRETVDEILLHWLHMARYHYSPEVPFLFVGTKKDLVPQDVASSLQVRLDQLQLPVLIGSCLDVLFPGSTLKELLRLRRHGHRSAPLLAPLPRLGLQLATQDARGRSNAEVPALQLAARDVTPPRAPSEPSSAREPWEIAAGELVLSSRLDAADRGAWQSGGCSPSMFAYWGTMPVVAKQVERSLLLKRCGSEDRLRRLLRELSVASCPYLAKFHGACLETEPISLVMEYMPGGDLERYLRSRRQEHHRPWVPPRSLLLRWAVGAAGAVAFLAGLAPPIAHGNLRPSNLLLCTSLALRLSPSGALAPIEHRHQAEVGAPNLESCLYSAPEVLRGEACDEVEKGIAADVFALGLVLWFMCTGTRPFQHLDNDGTHKPSDHVMEAFKEGRVPRPSLLVVKEPEFRAVLAEAWHEKPEERPRPVEIFRQLQQIQAKPAQSQCCNAM